MYHCFSCGKEYESIRALGGHRSHCSRPSSLPTLRGSGGGSGSADYFASQIGHLGGSGATSLPTTATDPSPLVPSEAEQAALRLWASGVTPSSARQVFALLAAAGLGYFFARMVYNWLLTWEPPNGGKGLGKTVGAVLRGLFG